MKGEMLRNFLDRKQVKYEVIPHPFAFTSTHIAHLSHVHSREMAKPVIVKVRGKYIMVVMPANQMVNLSLLRALYNTKDVELAHESEFSLMFPDCEAGAMPPFGNLYAMDEIVSEDLAKDDEIVFNAGTHTEVIKMKFHDFADLVHPRLVDFKFKL